MEANSLNPKPVRLEVLGPKGQVTHAGEFIKEKIVLGRILSADLRIDDPRVSRIHALLEVKGDVLTITDLASTHGTFLNGKKVVETKVSLGDKIKLGFVEVRVVEGSGQVEPTVSAFEGIPVFEGEETLAKIDASVADPADRRGKEERRNRQAFPEEQRLDDRRKGDRRIDERKGERRQAQNQVQSQKLPEGVDDDRRGGSERRKGRDDERRVGQRRRNDRRVFDITSLERRISDRRTRNYQDEILPEELEKAFDPPQHNREFEVTALWGDHILDVSNFAESVTLTAGESPENWYIIPSFGIPDEFPLFMVTEEGNAQLAFTDDMSGTVRIQDRVFQLPDLKHERFIRRREGYYTATLKQDDFAKVSIGKVNFFALHVKPAPRIKNAPVFDRDPIVLRTAIGSALFLACLFIGVALVPQPKPVTIEMIPERFAKIVIKKRPNLPKQGIVVKGEKPTDGGSEMGVGGPPPGPEGEVGPPDLPKKEKPQVVLPKSAAKDPAPTPVKKAPPAPPKPTPQRKVVDAKKAEKVGLLSALKSSALNKDLKALVKSDDGPEGPGGFDKFGKAVSGLKGRGIEESGGAGGRGSKGVDVGGGGKTVGLDGPSTGGYGRGYRGTGIGEGLSGPGRMGLKGDHAISIVSENVQVLSGLPKDVINAVVQSHRAEIRACYDSALQRNPNFRGKVVVAFNIQPTGIVSYAGVKENTVGDSALGNCIISRVRTWNFPKPEAPVVTEVSAYPFYLNPAN